MKNPKVLLLLVLVAAGGFFAYTKLSEPKGHTPKPRVNGTIVTLQPFTLNLADGRFAKLTVAAVIDGSDKDLEAAGEGTGAPALSQEAKIRSVIVDQLTGKPANVLLDADARAQTMREITAAVKKQTDQKVNDMFVSDLTVD